MPSPALCSAAAYTRVPAPASSTSAPSTVRTKGSPSAAREPRSPSRAEAPRARRAGPRDARTVSRMPPTRPTRTSRGASVRVSEPVENSARARATRPATTATPSAEETAPSTRPSSSTARRSWEPVAPTQRSSASSRARWAVSTDSVLVTTSSATSMDSPAKAPSTTASMSVPWDICVSAVSEISSGVCTVTAGSPPRPVPRMRLTSSARCWRCCWSSVPSVRSRIPELMP